MGYSIRHVYGLNSQKIGMLKSPSRFVYLYPKLAMYFRQLPGPRTEARRLCTQCRDGCVPPRRGECCNGKKQERRGQQNATSCLVKAKDRISWINAVFVAGWWLVSNTIFSIIYEIILPIDFHIFQDGYCTTNQVFHGTIVGLFDGLYEWYHQIGYLWRSINTWW